jgi:hypothetical protein
MRSAEEVYSDIQKRFSDKAGDEPGVVLGLFTAAVAKEAENIYRTIENNKTPHIWSKLEGQDLDDTGVWVNVPRDVGESDESYRYRLMQWKHLKEGATETAINTALLNPTYAADLQYVPLTNGTGTGTCYVIPKSYTEENITLSLQEAQERIKRTGAAGAYVDYIVPEIRAVSLEIYMETADGDETAIKNQLTARIKQYINSIAPGSYLSVGEINRMGVETTNVDFYSVLSLSIDGNQIAGTKVLQQIDSKFIFDSITWMGDSLNG